MEAVHKGKSIALLVYTTKEERSKINNLSFPFRKPEIKGQFKAKRSKKEII